MGVNPGALAVARFEDCLSYPRIQGGETVWLTRDGVRHRSDGPAVTSASGEMEWWVHGRRHREDGPAILHETGETLWWDRFNPHYRATPAQSGELFGRQEWWIDGERHRLDGPAVIDIINNVPYYDWFVRGEAVNDQDLNLLYLLINHDDLSDSVAFAVLGSVSPALQQLHATYIVNHRSGRLTNRARGYAALLL